MRGPQEESCPNSPRLVAAHSSPGLPGWKRLSQHQVKALSSKGGSSRCRELPESELAEARPLDKWAPARALFPNLPSLTQAQGCAVLPRGWDGPSELLPRQCQAAEAARGNILCSSCAFAP